MKSTLTVFTLFLIGTANAMILDNFTVPYSRTINTGSWVDYQTDDEIYTGERDVSLRILSATNGAAHLTIGEGEVTLSTENAQRAFGYLEYDGIGDEVNNTGAGRLLIPNPRSDLHFPEGTDRARFHIESVNAPDIFVLGVRLFQNGVEMFSLATNPNASGGGPRVVDVQLSPQAFAMCNTVQFRFALPDPNSSLVISKIELVPEPNGAMLLAGGAAVLGLSRHRKRST